MMQAIKQNLANKVKAASDPKTTKTLRALCDEIGNLAMNTPEVASDKHRKQWTNMHAETNNFLVEAR